MEMPEVEEDDRLLTLRVTDIPQTVIAKELLQFLESKLGSDSVFAIEISTDRINWKSRGFGRIQFATHDSLSKARLLFHSNCLVFKSHTLKLSQTYADIIPRPITAAHRLDHGVLDLGVMLRQDCMSVLETWQGVRGWVMPEKSRVEFMISSSGCCCYKLELKFEDILEVVGCCLGGASQLNALLFRLKYAPRIYQKVSGTKPASKMQGDRYRICKEDFSFQWVRTTDFSVIKSIGHSNSFCWRAQGLSALDVSCLPCYRQDTNGLTLENGGNKFSTSTEIAPLVKCSSDSNLDYEILFQLNSLVHTQKISLAAVDAELIEILSALSKDTALMILHKLHKLKSTCYDPLSFVKTESADFLNSGKRVPLSAYKRLTDHNIMSCHRALVTPSKIYCLGPELETSNYVVKNFAQYASDFMRVTFVDEDWSKLPVNCISTSIEQGIFAKPFRTKVYHRVLSVLRDGIVIGSKRFEFLAFSASQLRSNAVWMFASNENVTAQGIREWMGCFKKIRSVSKCAARMGQLFSSSLPTFDVPSLDVEMIPDIEVTTDGNNYCFSDGIGKISLPFARQVAQKCGLDHTPSAFQIRYGGYKGVLAVDRNSFRKISLRNSMLKFDSNVRKLNVTKWSESMPCFLNREIVSLLSTLGVKDEALEALQQDQLHLLGRMLSDREAALDVLQNIGGNDSKNILVKMMLQGYEPNVEPYLSMMLRAHHSTLLSDLKSRCRVFVPKGRVLIGCLDETGVLEYGQVFVRISLTRAELNSCDQDFFHKVDDETSIIIGKVVVTKNPCLHPGDVRVLDAVYQVELEEKDLTNCIVFPQKGRRPHPNECSGGDLDGDQFFISWDKDLIPCQTEPPMDDNARKARIMDHDVTLEEIQKFFVDYMISDTLGAISTAHLVHADREPNKALSRKCLELASLHSMAVDFAKTGAAAEMPRALKPREFPDFMERGDKPMYVSQGVLGKLYRAVINSSSRSRSRVVQEGEQEVAEAVYDPHLEVNGFESFLESAESHRNMYEEEMKRLMLYYGAESEEEILTGNLNKKSAYLLRDNRRYGDMKDRILISMKNLKKEARYWFEKSCCKVNEQQRLASAWYHVTYHPSYWRTGEEIKCLSFPWVVGDTLLNIKSVNSKMIQRTQPVFSNVYRKSNHLNE